ncbi:MAG: class I SAM-dependent methyltransferase [Mycoplasmataceae bacterium]|jgi:release factor glutamine methyltransferase|nr:class I SAM-dependent methyltransferase [Mycoplasmataceae bacterium]
MPYIFKDCLLYCNKNDFKNNAINYEIIYNLSYTIKNITELTFNLNTVIDFNFEQFVSDIIAYYKLNKPIGQIVSKIRYLNMDITTFKGILNPRVETESLINLAIKLLKRKYSDLRKGLDLCCGTGIIGLGIKNKAKHIKIISNDISKTAIKNTIFNAKANNLKIKTVRCDFKDMFNKKYDFITCNPPYVAKDDFDHELLKFENIENFISEKGDDIYFYKYIIKNYKKVIKNKKHFFILFEIGYNQEQKLKPLVENKKFKFKFYNDFANNNRMLLIYR